MSKTVKHQIDININDYDYHLPDERIALYPAYKRDLSQILIKNADGTIGHDTFRNLSNYINKDSCMVFNNSRVISARLIFHLNTGAFIEIFLIKPVDPSDYQHAMQSSGGCTWQCMVGNKRRFRKEALEMIISINGTNIVFRAEKRSFTGSIVNIKFTWDNNRVTFADILAKEGRTPLPPYIKRPDEMADKDRYQTIYSEVDGSVAAPTAGLHFTDIVLEQLRKKKVQIAHITLHVGAGTFLPVKTPDVFQHDMHAEFFSVTYECIESIMNAKGPVIAVGTTSARTIESLYWLGVKLGKPNTFNKDEPILLQQWEAYQLPCSASIHQPFENLLNWMQLRQLKEIHAQTKLMIVPGYPFRVADGLLTNFHQPKSTLLLLLAAFIGNSWKDAYAYAMDKDFRFLSYGDSSLFYKPVETKKSIS